MVPDTKSSDLIHRAASLLQEHWGLDGSLQRLPGENFNAAVLVDGIPKYVLKITTDPSADVDLEQAVLHRLADRGLPVPASIASIDGRFVIPVEQHPRQGVARLQAFLPGTTWRDASNSIALLHAIGSQVAHVHLALAEFDHPGADRTHQWDLSAAQQHRASIPLVGDPRGRIAIESAMHLHAAVVMPGLDGCPRGIIHGDANDENFLVDADRVVGLVDLGDCLHGALVQDLGITLAYAMQQPDASLEGIAPLVSGYHDVRPLTDAEIRLVVPIALARLATSALIGSRRMTEDPEHETWHSHAKTTLSALTRFEGTEPAAAENVLRRACSLAPTTDTPPESLLQSRHDHLGPNLSLAHGAPLHVVRGRGQYLYTAGGRPCLDLVNNVCHVGHCHPRVVEAIAHQASTLNTNTRYLHESILEYASKLAATMPEPLSVCYFVNSGSEANELALRLARAATGALDALVIDGAYHGCTPNCVAMSPYKFNGTGGDGPSDWVHVAPLPDTYRGEHRGEDAGAAYALEVADVIGTACRGGRSIAAFFAESMLSCGGQVPLPPGYLSSAIEHVRNAGGLYVADEVQVGFGRMGDAFWGFQLHDVVPDIVVLGKPIGNGHPMGAVVTTPEIASAFDNGMEFFSTFGGNPVSCACGLAVLDVIERESLQERARVLGNRFIEGFQVLQERHDCIGDVRGHGLFLGIELVEDRRTRTPAPALAARLVRRMATHGVLMSTDGPQANVIKIKPPMVLNEQDIDMTLRLVDQVLARPDDS